MDRRAFLKGILGVAALGPLALRRPEPEAPSIWEVPLDSDGCAFERALFSEQWDETYISLLEGPVRYEPRLDASPLEVFCEFLEADRAHARAFEEALRA